MSNESNVVLTEANLNDRLDIVIVQKCKTRPNDAMFELEIDSDEYEELKENGTRASYKGVKAKEKHVFVFEEPQTETTLKVRYNCTLGEVLNKSAIKSDTITWQARQRKGGDDIQVGVIEIDYDVLNAESRTKKTDAEKAMTQIKKVDNIEEIEQMEAMLREMKKEMKK